MEIGIPSFTFPLLPFTFLSHGSGAEHHEAAASGTKGNVHSEAVQECRQACQSGMGMAGLEEPSGAK